LSIYRPVVRRAVERFFFTGIGGSFGFRFNFSLKARCALRLGEGPRVFGFSMAIFSRCRGVRRRERLSINFDAWHKRRHNNSRATGAAASDG
jgi:hypothetical protein